MIQPEKIEDAEVPDVIRQTFVDWNKFSSANVVDQIDVGLRYMLLDLSWGPGRKGFLQSGKPMLRSR